MLIVPTVTPFSGTPSGHQRVDHDSVHQMTRFYIQHRVPALFALGTTGEFPLLSLQERQDALATFVQSASGDLDIIAHIGAASLRDVTELGEHALALGVRTAAVVTPYYFAYTQAELEAFFVQVSCALPGLELYAYTIPGRAGNTLEVSVIRRLAALPNIIGIKDSSGDMQRLLSLLEIPDFRVFAGADALALPFMQAGGAGMVSGLGGAIPEVFEAFSEALRTQDSGALLRTSTLIRRFDGLMRGGARLDFIRLALEWRGLSTGQSRSPLPQPSPEEGAMLRRALDDFAQDAQRAGISMSGLSEVSFT